jgi:hypothetical protein
VAGLTMWAELNRLSSEIEHLTKAHDIAAQMGQFQTCADLAQEVGRRVQESMALRARWTHEKFRMDILEIEALESGVLSAGGSVVQ